MAVRWFVLSILVSTCSLFPAGPTVAQQAEPERASSTTYETSVLPFLGRHCTPCHNTKMKTSGLNFEAFPDATTALRESTVWEKVEEKLRTSQMPPEGRPKPDSNEVKPVLRWIQTTLAQAQSSRPPDPGRVTARRLNRAEYNNTIRDLLSIDLRPAEDFPVDDEGYGFDNIGDVLSISPMLMEKYLKAAERISRQAIVVPTVLKPTIDRYKAEQLKQSGYVQAKHRFPANAEYEIRAGLGGIRPDGSPKVKLSVTLDGREINAVEVDPGRDKRRNFETRLQVVQGERELAAKFVEDTFDPEKNPIEKRDRYLTVDFIEVRGPFNPQPPTLTESHRRILVCGHPLGRHEPGCDRKILTNLVRRAYRRPVSLEEVDGLLRLVDMAQKEGDSFEEGIQVALRAVLVFPHFLFRIERDPAPTDPIAAHPVTDFELASRLSYFLWSSMPDEELFRLAEQKTLRKPAVLEAQVRRMLRDPKSRALVENFAGQWLQLRNLDHVKPDPDRFPTFDDELRRAMRTETELFFEAIMRQNRSLLDFLDARFTFLNERLARHYSVPGVKGDGFRRVRLKGDQRSGVLTHASLLTVSSYPTRTSPVLRGRFLLENFLNAPPPPPPPGLANVNEDAIGVSGTLRQQLEKHRSDPSCAVCHSRMDVLGFGLENYDAIGTWRAYDGNFPIDSSGTLPGGRRFRGPSQLKEILKSDREAFSQCMTEKLLTYALGRGLERFDRPAVQWITKRLSEDKYRFARLVLEIARSIPFQMRRREGGYP